MSGLLQSYNGNPIIGSNTGMQGNNDILQPVDYRIFLDYGVLLTFGYEIDIAWPRSHLRGSILEYAQQSWEWEQIVAPTGVHVRKKISGQTFDAIGNLLGSAVVQLFNTATGLLVDTQTSDSGGNYTCGDPNAVNCFAVAYEAGAPDVAGTTKNNLAGT